MCKLIDIIQSKDEYPETQNITSRVAVIIFKPDVWQDMNWSNPSLLIDQYIKDIYESSHHTLKYQVDIISVCDSFPEFENNWNFVDSDDYYVKFKNGLIPNVSCDYAKTIEKFHKDLPDVDEYWWFGAPYFGFYESRMFGKNPIWCNSPSLKYNSRNKIIMGFNYERGIGEMLEDFSHRTEFTMFFCEGNVWQQFLKDNGSVHCPPNTKIDYDWGNKNLVETNCDTWYDWPNYTNKRKITDCEEWGNGDMREHHIWWLKHLPKNWFQYICNLSIIENDSFALQTRNIKNIGYYKNKFDV
jgi:hypothetical protein